jgi:transposase InsO family protein
MSQRRNKLFAEYCGQGEHHEYELYLAVENIDHSRTKARHPRTNGICERFHRTIQEEFSPRPLARSFTPVWRNCRRIWMTGWPSTIGHTRTRGSTAMARPRWTFLDSVSLAREKCSTQFRL